ncbi:MAG: nucleoside triphosphate pyrophosphohydrolase [Rhodospirillaceae bacterium]|nr:nucleoside triphosphate pyrophosphohydrolase [Rhodospirillaceae bacterium]|tara:strand:+ start:11340 stop:12137 length:798 start_codon:yes stop_codon:yes gene_type:complete
MTKRNNDIKEIEELLSIMSILRDPQSGCDWDKKQTFESLINHTIEETYEVIDAIKSKKTKNIIEELGDLLLQIVFYAQIANEKNLFNFFDIVKTINKKMIRRHPHVFNSNKNKISIDQINKNWEEIKKIEKNIDPDTPFYLNSYNEFPNLLKAYKIQQKVSKMRFQFENEKEIFNKLNEESGELKGAINEKNIDRIEEELGDMLFTIANLSTYFNINPEIALYNSNKKFIKRFNYVSKEIKKLNENFDTISKEKLEFLWEKSKLF